MKRTRQKQGFDSALRVAKALSEQLESKYFYVTTFPQFHTNRVHEASANKISSK